jgi:hypothetical protein
MSATLAMSFSLSDASPITRRALESGAPIGVNAVGHWIMAGSPSLFEYDLPTGFHYRENFITEADERVLLDAIADVAFSDFEMRGVVVRRRVAFFGQSYARVTAGPCKDCAVGWRRFRSVCHGAHQRVSGRLTHRLAS